MNNREIKRRISYVKETVKIYRAMYSISVAKMLKAKALLPAAERFYSEAEELLSRVAKSGSIYFTNRGERTAFIVIGGDKGLCGDYNDRVVEAAVRAFGNKAERSLFTIGSVTRDKLAKSGYEADVEFLHSADNPLPENAYSMAADLMSLFDEGMPDEIRLVYSSVKDNQSEPIEEKILPCEGEPSPLQEEASEEAVRRAVFTHLAASLYRALVLSSLAEHLARVKAMPRAIENAEKMIEDLTAKYNRVRQEGITRALQEVGSYTDNGNEENV